MMHLPPELERDVTRRLDDWRSNDKVTKLWNKDASLWTGRDEDQWLGWLDLGDAAVTTSPSSPISR